MKKIFKKNQIVVTSLALMIAVAGYLNYSGKVFELPGGDPDLETTNELANQELLDISEEDISTTQTIGDIESVDGELVADSDSKEGIPGDSVLTSSSSVESIASAKVSREQVRAASKETLQALIDNEQLSAEQKETAVNQLIGMTKIAEQETTIESMLEAKGFDDVVVTLTEDAADVLVVRESITEAHLAQIEDMIQRKTEITPENIVITPVETGE